MITFLTLFRLAGSVFAAGVRTGRDRFAAALTPVAFLGGDLTLAAPADGRPRPRLADVATMSLSFTTTKKFKKVSLSFFHLL